MELEELELFGDKYILRGTFDILDYQVGIYGFEVMDTRGKNLFYIDSEDIKDVIAEIKWRIYHSFV